MARQQQQEEEEAKSGCFSRFFRILLCSHSSNAPPIHPSDQLPPPQTLPSSHPNKSFPVSTTPGLVARLMGLDSLPNTSRVSPDSVPRSKSVNFIDYLLQFDPIDQEQQGSYHRRVRTSSFREVPVLSSSSATTPLSFQPEKNGDVVVFLWDDDADTAARESRPGEVVRRSSKKQVEVGLRESKKKQRKEENEEGTKKKKKISKLKNEPRRRVSVSSPRMRKEEFVEPRFRKKFRSKKTTSKKMQNERCSENLSPVSVLDLGDDEDFPLQIQTSFTEETKGMALKSKRACYYSAERGRKSDHDTPSSSKSGTREECSEIMGKLRKLAENDVHQIQMFDICVGRIGRSDDCFQEISLLLEHNIFDLLLLDLVHELLTL